MSFLKNIFKSKEPSIKSNKEFWAWFQQNERAFFNVVKQKGQVDKEFFGKLSPKLAQLKDGFYFLTGMYNDNTVELILTADGAIKNIFFVEELVKAAPKIDGWRFTTLKPGMDIKNLHIEMAGYKFGEANIHFYANESREHPDEIAITVVHDDLNADNKPTITNGVYIFLDNFIGELNFATTVDNVHVIAKADAEKELVPIEKLKDFLIWREKEFIEKYEGTRHHIENDNYSMLQAELENGNPLLAVINVDLLNWDSKASHPWILSVEIKYGRQGKNGMPDDRTYQLLDKIEDEIQQQLKDVDGYLNIGRQTAENTREIYFACKDFRKPSAVLYQVKQQYAGQLNINYDLYKDKYWQSFNRFKNN